MKSNKIMRIILSFVLLFSMTFVVPAYAEEGDVQPPGDNVGLQSDESRVLVVFSDRGENASDYSTAARVAPLGSLGMTDIETLTEASEDFPTIVRADVPDGSDVHEMIEEISSLPGVEYAQPDYRYGLVEEPEGSTGVSDVVPTGSTTTALTDDPYLSQQYYLKGSEEHGSSVIEAWDSAQCEQTVTVAVLDTGIRVDHEDLVDNIDTDNMRDIYRMTEPGTITSPSVPYGDNDGHGTHVAGIIAATAANGVGIAGASYNAKVLPLKVFDDSAAGNPGAYTSDLVRAYNYLLDQVKAGKVSGLHAINMSLGGYGIPGEVDRALEVVIQTLRYNYDVITVAAGGNGNAYGPNTGPHMPSDLESVVAVTSLSEEGRNTTWSDYNENKNISAPGEKILSTFHKSKSSYETLSGTSMASPLVAGCFALLWAVDPTLNAEDAIQIVYETADPVNDPVNDRTQPDDRGIVSGSHGAINAAKAVQDLEERYTDPTKTRMRDCTVVEIEDQLFTGRLLSPVPVVEYQGKTLTADVDYTVSYISNRNVGTGSVVLKGAGDYIGFLVAPFKIFYDVAANAIISKVNETYQYFGEPIAPEPVVTREGKKLVPDVDYTVSYRANDVPGTAYVVVEGIGMYRGVLEKPFIITAYDIGAVDVVGMKTEYYHTGKPIKPESYNVLYGNRLLVENIDFTASFANNTDVGTATMTLTGMREYTGSKDFTFEIVVDPTKPTEPTDPTDPTDPVKPGDPDPVNPIVFTDVPKDSSEWYVPWVYSAVERGLVSGYTDGRGNFTGSFGPHDQITRGQVATIMYRASVEDAMATTDVKKYAANQTSFTDVPDSRYYTAAINWARENGILLGDTGTTLARPEDNISRQELATMMHRLAQLQDISPATTGMDQNPAITDWSLVANWAYDHILWTSNTGVMGGFDNHDGTFTLRPFDTASRAEMAKMIVALTDLEDVE